MSQSTNSTLLAQLDLGESLKIGGESASSLFDTPADIINKLIVPNVFVAAGFIMLAIMIAGGFKILSAGSDSKGLEKGKEQLTNAAIGFILVFSAYWIVELIQLLTGVEIF